MRTAVNPGQRGQYDRESLLEVAVAVFNQRGYDGTSMDALATAAGLSKSSIYHHFAGKEALLGDALDRALDALFAVLAEPPAVVGRAVDRFEHVLRRTAETLVDELPYVTLLLRLRGNSPTETRALRRRREFDRRVSALLVEAAADGDIPAAVDPDLTTRLLFGMVNSVSEWYRPGRGMSRSDVGDAIVDLARHGLRTSVDNQATTP